VIGTGKTAILTALRLLHFRPTHVTILTHGEPLFNCQQESTATQVLRTQVETAGVEVVESEIQSLFGITDHVFGVEFSNGERCVFDIAFSALGLHQINNVLARTLGGQVDEAGYVIVDSDCQVLDEAKTPIPGVYAIGDVRDNWNQIMLGFGDADRAIIHAWGQRLPI
jgi:thioredoxin reductase